MDESKTENTSLQTNTNTNLSEGAVHADGLGNQCINSTLNSLPEEAEDTTISSASSSFSIVYGILSEIDRKCNYIKIKTNTTEQTYYIQESLFNPNSSINKTHQFLQIIPLSLITEYVAVYLDSSNKVIAVQRFLSQKDRDKLNIPKFNPLELLYFPDKLTEPEPTKSVFVLFPTTLQPSYTKQLNNKFKYNPSFTGSTTLDKELYEYIQNHCDTFGTINPSSPEYPLILNEQSHTLDDILEHYILITQLKRYDDGTIKIHYVFIGKLKNNINLSNYGFSYVKLQKDPNRTFAKPLNPKKFLKSDAAFQHYLNIQNNTTTKYGFQKKFTYKFNNQNQTTHADIVIQPISGDYSIKNILDYIRNPENIADYTSPFKLSSVHEICIKGKTYYDHFKYESQAFIFPVNLPKNTLKSLKKPLFLDQNLTQLLDIYTKNRLILKYRYISIYNIAGINRVLPEKLSILKTFQHPKATTFLAKYSDTKSCSLLHFSCTGTLSERSDENVSKCMSNARYVIETLSDSVYCRSISPFEFIHLFSLYIHDQNQLNRFFSKLEKPYYYNFSDNYIPSTQTILQLFRKSNFKTKTKKLDYEKLKQNPYEVYKQLNQSCSYIPIYHSFDFIKDTIPYREPLPEDKLHIYFTAKQNNISYDSAELYLDLQFGSPLFPNSFKLVDEFAQDFLQFAQNNSNTQLQINNYYTQLSDQIQKLADFYNTTSFSLSGFAFEASRTLQNQFSLSTNIISHIQPENGLESLLEPLNAKLKNYDSFTPDCFSTQNSAISQIYQISHFSSFSLISHKNYQICIKIHQNIQIYEVPYIDDS